MFNPRGSLSVLISPWKRPRRKHKRKHKRKDQNFSFSYALACACIHFYMPCENETPHKPSTGEFTISGQLKHSFKIAPRLNIWTKFPCALLILVKSLRSRIVRNYRMLYDKKSRKFKDGNEKAQVWIKLVKFTISNSAPPRGSKNVSDLLSLKMSIILKRFVFHLVLKWLSLSFVARVEGTRDAWEFLPPHWSRRERSLVTSKHRVLMLVLLLMSTFVITWHRHLVLAIVSSVKTRLSCDVYLCYNFWCQ